METIEKVLLVLGILAVLALPITMKVAGATELPRQVEMNGYCKTLYGDNFHYSKTSLSCSGSVNGESKTEFFTEEEFRNVCPKHKISELSFYSECFNKG